MRDARAYFPILSAVHHRFQAAFQVKAHIHDASLKLLKMRIQCSIYPVLQPSQRCNQDTGEYYTFLSISYMIFLIANGMDRQLDDFLGNYKSPKGFALEQTLLRLINYYRNSMVPYLRKSYSPKC